MTEEELVLWIHRLRMATLRSDVFIIYLHHLASILTAIVAL